jgi:hypothetical protein
MKCLGVGGGSETKNGVVQQHSNQKGFSRHKGGEIKKEGEKGGTRGGSHYMATKTILVTIKRNRKKEGNK